MADVPTLKMGGFPFVEGSRLFTASLSGYVILCISECIYVMQMYQEATQVDVIPSDKFLSR